MSKHGFFILAAAAFGALTKHGFSSSRPGPSVPLRSSRHRRPEPTCRPARPAPNRIPSTGSSSGETEAASRW